MKKPVLNPTLTLSLTLGLPAKHSDVFHCLYKGKFLVSSILFYSITALQ